MKPIRSILASMFILSLNAEASDVLLHMAADSNATVIGRIPHTHKAFKSGIPVSNTSKASDGWHQTTFKTTYKGYVPTDELGKNFSVQPGTRVLVNPTKGAPVLTSCEEDDRIIVSSISDDRAWATVRFNKSETAYYLLSELPHTVAIDSPRPQQANISRLEPNKPVVNVDTHRKGRETSVSIPEGTITGYTPIGPTDLVATTEDNSTPSNQTEQISTNAVIRNLVGTLQRERGQAPASYPLRLYNGNKRIAYVDMSDIFISDLRPYLNKEVLIQGETRPLNAESTESVIQARSIQLTN